jgi:hypothetical protein
VLPNLSEWDHARKEEVANVYSSLKGNYNFIQIGKNNLEDPFTYACAMYMTKKLKPIEVIDFLSKEETPLRKGRFHQSYN